MRLQNRCVVLLLALTVVACQTVPESRKDAWRTTDPQAGSWDLAKLEEARDYAKQIGSGALLIVHDGQILYSWGEVTRVANVHSVRKSFLSALYGVYVPQGKIDLTKTLGDVNIDDHPPGLTPQEKLATVGDLLKSRSGVYHVAAYETDGMKRKRPARGAHAAGSHFFYNNWDFNALGTIFENAVGKSVFTAFEEEIALPIGMEDFKKENGRYVSVPESIHRAYLFSMSARDMARFGQLYLQNGNWNGRQIIPAAWVRESTTAYSDAAKHGGYGYLWWTASHGNHFPGVTLPDGSYSARGHGGHFIVVIPNRRLVIVHRPDTIGSSKGIRDLSEFGKLLNLILLAQP